MSTYAEVELRVTVKLSQPWSDNESADVVRKRAKSQATEKLERALIKGAAKGIIINDQAVTLIYSREPE